MEITLDRLKMIIGDQACQITILQTEKAQLVTAYNQLVAENKKLAGEKATDEKATSEKPKKTKKATVK